MDKIKYAKKALQWFFSDAINIFVWTRKWTVEYGDWYSGHSKSFWFKKNASNFAVTRGELFVNIRNEITSKHTVIRNNPDNIPAPMAMTFR